MNDYSFLMYIFSNINMILYKSWGFVRDQHVTWVWIFKLCLLIIVNTLVQWGQGLNRLQWLRLCVHILFHECYKMGEVDISLSTAASNSERSAATIIASHYK